MLDQPIATGGRDVHGLDRSRPNRLFLAAVGVYLAGLVGWLTIGLLPSLVHASPSLHRWLERLAASPGAWRVYAYRLLHPPMAMATTGSTVAVQYLFSVLNLGLGILLIVRRPDRTVPRLLAFALLGTAATFNHPSHRVFDIIGQPPVVKAVHFTFHIVSGVTYMWAVFLFPDGHAPARLSLSEKKARILAASVTLVVAVICWRSSFISHPQFFVVFFGALVPAIGIPVQTMRLHEPGTLEQHQQARLLRLALIPALAAALAWILAWGWDHAGLADGSRAVAVDHWLAAVFPALFALVPVMLLIGVLRFRLWDIDVVVSRVVLYGSALTIIGLVYVIVVAVAGQVVGASAAAAVVAMAVAAVAVLPAYESLHRIANRVAFGQVLDPTEALRALAQGLEQVAPAGELDQVADVIVRGTRATEASVWLEVDGALERVAQAPRPTALEPRRTVFDGRAGVASWAKAVGADHAAAIVHDGRLLGLIAIVLPPLVSLPPNECRLLDDLAAEAGLLAHNAAMVSELARHVARLDEQAAELRLSCQRIVAISDQERRALERDLHDGAQQDLVGLLMRLGALAGPPTPVQRTDLTDLVEASRAAVVERCGGGLPARLLTDGLGPALLAATAPMQTTGLVVDISVHLTSRPPPDIEGSVYFCCLEALQNAAKHAHATIVRVDISADGPYLQFNVVDNGVGFSALPDRHGSGLRHLNERLAVIGGAPTVWSAPGAGTTVTGRIPLAESARSQ